MKKKIVAMSLAAAMLSIAVIGGTLAYFTDTTEVKTNTFTVGNVEIDLTEPSWGNEEHNDLYPGERLDKDPTVTNVGNNPCFVRVHFVMPEGVNYESGNDFAGGNTLGEGWFAGNDGYYYYSKPLCVAGAENDSWNADANLTAATTPVFDRIRLSTSVTNDVTDNADGSKTYEITEALEIPVYAEAVQAQGAKAPNWAAVKGMTQDEIVAWFNTCMPAAQD